MAALLKFKLLATQCTTAKSPSRKPPSPSATATAPSRRRSTLRKLLARSPIRAGLDRTGGGRTASAEKRNRKGRLRDLLLSSPPPPLDGERTAEIGRVFRPVGSAGPVRRGRRFGPAGFRYRLMVRRTWRPVLVSIPE